MSKIRVLDADVCKLIAAGEVVNSCASVVKELVENAIDAGATRIEITIENGGKSRIRVVDNGCGMNEEDIELAFVQNATSKIATKDDIEHIMTMGFRGEALFSVALVSHVEVVSKTKEQELGTQLVLSCGKVVKKQAMAANTGTIITVENLFFNVPARRKHLREDRIEAKGVIDIVSKIAVGHVNIAFKMVANHREVFSTPGNKKLSDALYRVYGAQMVRDYVDVFYENEPLTLKGMVLSPNKANEKKHQILYYVNGRIVKIPKLTAHIEAVYKKYYGVEKFGAVLFIGLPADRVDVNIHPSKETVHFINENLIFMLISQGITDALRETFKITNFTQLEPAAMPQGYTKHSGEGDVKEEGVGEKRGLLQPHSALHDEFYNPIAQSGASFVAQQMEGGYGALDPQPCLQEEQQDTKNQENVQTSLDEENYFDYYYDEETATQALYRSLRCCKYLGNVFGLYALFERKDALYALDTHAAHERILYEENLALLSCYNNNETVMLQEEDTHDADNKKMNREEKQHPDIATTTLLVPVAVELGAAELQILIENEAAFSNNGFTIVADSYHKTGKIISIPAYFDAEQSATFLKDALDELLRLEHIDVAINRNEKILAYACHNSVRGNSDLSYQEVCALLDKLVQTHAPFDCPHGRPIVAKLESKDFQKVFKRL